MRTDTNNLRIIGVDAGYGNIKTANTLFQTGLIAYENEPLFNGNILNYQGKWYRVGEGHKPYLPDKTEDEDFYLLTLAAVASELSFHQITQADVLLAVGLPLTWTGRQREAFRSYMMQNQDVEYNYNDKDYHLHVTGCNVFPQGYAAVVPTMDKHPEIFKGTVVLADIGNGTMNTLYLVDGVPDENRSFTEELGVKQCMTATEKTLMNSFGINADEGVIQQILQTGSTNIAPTYLTPVIEVARRYVISIFDALRKHGYDPRIMRLYIVGGGGLLVKNFGQYDSDSVTIEQDICGNAKGFEYLAQGLLWNRKQAVR